MPSWEQWRELAQDSLQAARALLDQGHTRVAASRAYFAAYQMVTGVLLKLEVTLPTNPPRTNWSHQQTQTLYWRAIAQRRTSKHSQLLGLRLAFAELLQTRRTADYRPDLEIEQAETERLVVKAGSLIDILNELIDSQEI